MTTKDIVIDLSNYSDDDYSDDGYSVENLENDSVPTVESLIPCESVDVAVAYGVPEESSCIAETKYSGDTINLSANPTDGIGPYTVRFWRKAGGTGGTYIQIGDTFPVEEDTTITEEYELNDFDLSHATGDTTAGIPTSDDAGNIIEPFGGEAYLAPSHIRVATTVADSCPLGSKICISYCDVPLGCTAPTCNFTVF